MRHTFVSSLIYELPWARDKMYGGWQVNGIVYLRSGLPLTVTQAQGVRSTGTGNRPNRICDGKLDNPTIEKWFDTSCFVAPTDTTATYGDSGRDILEGPGQFNIDASLIKNTRFGRVNTEFRIEAFNMLNHPQFANPNTTLGNAAFGHLGDAVESVLLALRHDRAQRAARVQGDVLDRAGRARRQRRARPGTARATDSGLRATGYGLRDGCRRNLQSATCNLQSAIPIDLPHVTAGQVSAGVAERDGAVRPAQRRQPARVHPGRHGHAPHRHRGRHRRPTAIRGRRCWSPRR